MLRSIVGLIVIALVHTQVASAQDSQDIKELKLRDWHPRSMLITKTTEVPKPAFPVIDVHNHLGGGKAFLTTERVKHYVEEMDAAGVQTVVNLDGGWGERLKETLAALDQAHPGRFLTYAQLDFSGIDDAELVRPRGRPAGRELQSRRQGPQVSQVPRPGRPLSRWPVPPRRRSQARPDLGSLCPL